MRKVAVTGIGSITACGIGKDTLWQAILHGLSGAKQLKSISTNGLPIKIAAEANEFNPLDFMDAKSARRLDRSGQLAISAAELTIDDAAIDLSNVNKERCGVIDGSSLSSLGMVLDQYQGFLLGEKGRGGPTMLVCGMTGNSSAAISMKYKFKGPSATLSHGSVSSACAIGWGLRAIEKGELDMVVAGGTEAPIHRAILTPFSKAGVLSKENDNPSSACRPFSLNRNGFVLGEGAVYLLLEELDHALNRNAHIYCLLAGFAESSDACHPTSPDPKALMLSSAMKHSIGDADLKLEDISYINMHGTATNVNDIAESQALNNVFGRPEKQPLANSTKPITGHLLGATGSVEAAVCSLAIDYQIIPPMINGTPEDPECSINRCHEAYKTNIKSAISLNASFGGRNSSLVFNKYENNNYR